MIKVLQNWEEIGQSVLELGRCGIPRHSSLEKCWDFRILTELVDGWPSNIEIVDMGCSGLHTLGLLGHLGFKRMWGVDLCPTVLDRVKMLRMMIDQKKFSLPFKIKRQDMTQTSFESGRFELATCISVLEHGVDRDRFMAEAGRLLKVGGFLMVTADYWQEKIDMDGTDQQFNLPWQILSREDVEGLIDSGRRYGLKLKQEMSVPECSDRCIIWQDKTFTFICLVFVRE